MLKENMRDIYHSHSTMEETANRLNQWGELAASSGLAAFETLARTFQKQLGGILYTKKVVGGHVVVAVFGEATTEDDANFLRGEGSIAVGQVGIGGIAGNGARLFGGE